MTSLALIPDFPVHACPFARVALLASLQPGLDARSADQQSASWGSMAWIEAVQCCRHELSRSTATPCEVQIRCSESLVTRMKTIMRWDCMQVGVLGSGRMPKEAGVEWVPQQNLEALTNALAEGSIQGALIEAQSLADQERHRARMLEDAYPIGWLSRSGGLSPGEVMCARALARGRFVLDAPGRVQLEEFRVRCGIKRFLRHLSTSNKAWILKKEGRFVEPGRALYLTLDLEREVRIDRASQGLIHVRGQSGPGSDLGSIIGMEAVKAQALSALQEYKEWEPGRCPRTRGILLHGPPGTGKTALARALLQESGLHTIEINATDVFDMWFGESERKLRDLGKLLREYGSAVCLIDEIDGIGGNRDNRSSGDSHIYNAVLTALLGMMDAANRPDCAVLFIATTNRLSALDPALTRAGRFDLKIHVAPLSDHERKQVLLQELPELARHPSELHLAVRLHPDGSYPALKNLADQVREDSRHQPLVGALRARVVDAALGPVTNGGDEDLKTTAFHEAGHAILAALQAGKPPLFVTIRPRMNRYLGVMVSESDGCLTGNRDQVLMRMAGFLAGPMAERIFCATPTNAGTCADYQHATKIALQAISEWGLDPTWGPIPLSSLPEEVRQVRAVLLHERLEAWMKEAEALACKLLRHHRTLVTQTAEALLNHGDLFPEQLEKLLTQILLKRSKAPRPRGRRSAA